MASSNNRISKVIIGVAIFLIAGLVLGAVHLYGDAQVHGATIDQHDARLVNTEKDLRSLQENIADIKADIREIRVILERMEQK